MNRIVDYILNAVHKTDFASLQAFWNHLSKTFFSRLNHDMKNAAHKLESTILRLFLINAHRSTRHDEIKAFFERMAVVLQDRRDWKDWFGESHTQPMPRPHNYHTSLVYIYIALPYTKNPDQHPVFKLYFSKDWYDAFVVSLFNFFSLLFSSVRILIIY